MWYNDFQSCFIFTRYILLLVTGAGQLFAVGVTGHINRTELETIVSQPYEQYFLLVDDFEQLLASTQMIAGMACAKSGTGVVLCSHYYT